MKLANVSVVLPRDQFGHKIEVGQRYAVGPVKSAGVPVTVYCDVESNEWMLRRVHGDPRPQRVEDVDSKAFWTLIDENDEEITADPGEQTLSDVIDAAINRARSLKDQLEGIEHSLVESLNAHGNTLLIDEIQLLIHGDGRREKVLELASCS